MARDYRQAHTQTILTPIRTISWIYVHYLWFPVQDFIQLMTVMKQSFHMVQITFGAMTIIFISS